MKPTRILISAAALAVALLSLHSAVFSAGSDAASVSEHASAAPDPGEMDRRAAARAAHSAAEHEVTALPTLSREERIAGMRAEGEMATTNRQVVFETNILNLRSGAAEAEAEGHVDRAALMRRRADRLEARMSREASEG